MLTSVELLGRLVACQEVCQIISQSLGVLDAVEARKLEAFMEGQDVEPDNVLQCSDVVD